MLQPCSSMTLSVYFLKSSKMFTFLLIFVMSFDLSFANFESRSISEMKICLSSTSGFSFVVASSRGSRVLRWNSSGKACMMHSMRYCWEIVSLHCTITSKSFGRTKEE